MGRKSILMSDGIAGMACILLKEAWLLGKPVVSLQPGLRLKPLRMLEARESVVFIDSYETMNSLLDEWNSKIRINNSTTPRPELRMQKKHRIRFLGLLKNA